MPAKKASKTRPAKKASPKAKPAAASKPAAVPPKKAAPVAPPVRAVAPAPAKRLVKPKRQRSGGGRGARPVAGGGERHNRLGRKWSCYKCGAKFYDLNHPEPLCPKCRTDQRTRPKDLPRSPTPAPPRPREPRPLALLDDDDATREDEALGPEDLDLEFAGIGEEEELGDAPELGAGEEEEEAAEEE